MGRCRYSYPTGYAPTAGATATPSVQGAIDLHAGVSNSSPSATQAADRDTTKQAQALCTSITTKGTPRRKRTVQQIDAEEQADRAATEIVDLVEQDAQRAAGSRTGPSTSLDRHQSSSMATGAAVRSAYAKQEEDVAIPAWVINESRESDTTSSSLFLRPGRTARWGLRAGGSHWHAVLYIL